MSPVLDCDDRRTGFLPVAFLNPSPSAPPKFSRHQDAIVLSCRHSRQTAVTPYATGHPADASELCAEVDARSGWRTLVGERWGRNVPLAAERFQYRLLRHGRGGREGEIIGELA